jgi:RNA polymerase sigma-70 factor (ECF subfamily)
MTRAKEQDDERERVIGAHLDEGDLQAAATAAILGYGPELLGYLSAVLRDRSDADEVFAQLGEDMWRGLAGFRRESSFRTWTYKLAWHAALRHRRDRFRRRGQALRTRERSELAEAVRSVTAAHLRTSKKDHLAALRATLSPEEQSILVLRLDRGLPWDDVARVLSRPRRPVDAAAVRKRFERIKERLRQSAIERGLLEP